jgi:hypothetical protein
MEIATAPKGALSGKMMAHHMMLNECAEYANVKKPQMTFVFWG